MSQPVYSLQQIKRNQGGSGQGPQCQKCLEKGHWTYDCKGKAKYVSRPSRTKQLQKPIVLKRQAAVVPVPLEKRKGLADRILLEREQKRQKDGSTVGSDSGDSDGSAEDKIEEKRRDEK